MNKYLPFAVALTVIVLIALISCIDRGDSAMLDHLVKTVNETPSVFDQWKGVDNDPAKEVIIQETGAKGNISRNYSNTSLGEEIGLYYIAGLSGKVAIHPPTACYPGAGYKLEGIVQDYDFPYIYTDSKSGVQYNRIAHFHKAIFSKDAERVCVFWSWNNGKKWEIPSFPRTYYGGHSPLCKCYFILNAKNKNDSDNIQPIINDFVVRFLADVDNRMLSEGKLPDGELVVKPEDIGKPENAAETEPAAEAPADDSGEILQTPETEEQVDAIDAAFSQKQ